MIPGPDDLKLAGGEGDVDSSVDLTTDLSSDEEGEGPEGGDLDLDGPVHDAEDADLMAGSGGPPAPPDRSDRSSAAKPSDGDGDDDSLGGFGDDAYEEPAGGDTALYALAGSGGPTTAEDAAMEAAHAAVAAADAAEAALAAAAMASGAAGGESSMYSLASPGNPDDGADGDGNGDGPMYDMAGAGTVRAPARPESALYDLAGAGSLPSAAAATRNSVHDEGEFYNALASDVAPSDGTDQARYQFVSPTMGMGNTMVGAYDNVGPTDLSSDGESGDSEGDDFDLDGLVHDAGDADLTTTDLSSDEESGDSEGDDVDLDGLVHNAADAPKLDASCEMPEEARVVVNPLYNGGVPSDAFVVAEPGNSGNDSANPTKNSRSYRKKIAGVVIGFLVLVGIVIGIIALVWSAGGRGSLFESYGLESSSSIESRAIRVLSVNFACRGFLSYEGCDNCPKRFRILAAAIRQDEGWQDSVTAEFPNFDDVVSCSVFTPC